jgi:hypothetical protein
MDDTYYSIEWLPKSSEYNCWNQFALTHSKWKMRFYRIEVWLRHHKTSKTRVREL